MADSKKKTLQIRAFEYAVSSVLLAIVLMMIYSFIVTHIAFTVMLVVLASVIYFEVLRRRFNRRHEAQQT